MHVVREDLGLDLYVVLDDEVKNSMLNLTCQCHIVEQPRHSSVQYVFAGIDQSVKSLLAREHGRGSEIDLNDCRLLVNRVVRL